MTYYRLPDGTIVAAKGPRAAARLQAEGATVVTPSTHKPRRKAKAEVKEAGDE